MPRANTLFIGRVPPALSWRGREDASGETDGEQAKAETQQTADAAKTAVQPQIIDWDRSHPLLSSVELGNVDIADSLVLDPPAGATVLIDSTAGPIAAIAPRDAYQDAVLGFEIFGQDKDGVANREHQLAAAAELSDVLAQRAGVSGRRDRRFANRVRRAGPAGGASHRGQRAGADRGRSGGQGVHRARTAEDVFQFHDTQRLGVYDVQRARPGDRAVRRQPVRSPGERRARAAQPGSKAATRSPRPISASAMSTSRRRSAARRRARRPGRSSSHVPWSCWCSSGISTIAACICRCYAER